MDRKKVQEAAQLLAEAAASDGMASGPTGSSGKQEDPEYLTMKETSAITKLSRWTIRRMIKKGLIKASKIGNSKSGRLRIVKASVYALLASQEIKSPNN